MKIDDKQECCADNCNWSGPLDDTVYCGSVGPLCPECYEVTERVLPANRPKEIHQPKRTPHETN